LPTSDQKQQCVPALTPLSLDHPQTQKIKASLVAEEIAVPLSWFENANSLSEPKQSNHNESIKYLQLNTSSKTINDASLNDINSPMI
jgi:hypothetical protein